MITGIERDPETIPAMFVKHLGQSDAWLSQKRIVAIFKGWRAGGTTIGPPWLLREISRRGPGDYGVIAPNYPLLGNFALPEMQNTFGDSAAKVQWRDLFRLRGSENEFVITPKGKDLLGFGGDTKCRILLRHTERASAIEAFGALALWVDEPGQIPDEIWESIESRVAIAAGRILLTSRPYDINWYITKIWDRVMVNLGTDAEPRWTRKPDADPLIDVINFRSIDNPVFPVAEYERQKGLLPPWKFAMKYDGIPTRPAGSIFDVFTQERNTCPRFKVPAHWPLYAGVDFGPDNTAVVIFAQELNAYNMPTGRFYLIAAYHSGPHSDDVPEKDTAAGHILQVQTQLKLAIEGAPNQPIGFAGSQQELGWRGFWTLAGFPLSKPSNGSHEFQIDCVWTAMKRTVNEGLFPGKAQLVVFDDLGLMISDIRSYRRKHDKEGNPTQEIENRSKMHRIDAMLYLGPDLFALPLSARGEAQITVHKQGEKPQDAEIVALERAIFKSRSG